MTVAVAIAPVATVTAIAGRSIGTSLTVTNAATDVHRTPGTLTLEPVDQGSY
jgi:hypothetical protein